LRPKKKSGADLTVCEAYKSSLHKKERVSDPFGHGAPGRKGGGGCFFSKAREGVNSVILFPSSLSRDRVFQTPKKLLAPGGKGTLTVG